MKRLNIPTKETAVANKKQQHIAGLLQQGFSHHRKGHFSEAQKLYNKILELQPRHFDALQLSAAIATQTSSYEIAVKLFDEALAIKPGYAEGYYNLGIALQALMRLDEALASYDRAIAIKPDYAEAYYTRGTALQALSRLDDALASYDHAIAIKPDHAKAYYNRGTALQALTRIDDALASYDRAVVIKPDYAEAYYNRGTALHALSRLDDALASYDRAIAIKPDHAKAYYNRGTALQVLSRLDDALASYDRAIAIKPDYAEAYNNRGLALQALSRLDDALASYDHAIAIKPDYAEAYNNRGIALLALTRVDDALASYDRAIAIMPDYAEAYNNRGNALQALTRVDDTLASYDLAIAIKPDYATAYFNKSMFLLLGADFKLGWQWYEWRWRREHSDLQPRSFRQPLWLGVEDIANKTILLHAEQGLGDTIQFCRYAKLVQAKGAKVLLEVPKALIGLMHVVEGVDLLLERGKPLPTFDYHCPLLSLPLAFKTEMDTIPGTVAYLSDTNHKREEWAAKLGEKRKPRIGLVWSGSTIHKNDHNRSLSLSELLPALPDGFEYVCLQKEVRVTDKDLLAKSPINHYCEQLTDFTDTAALCNLMDVIISVDTSVAHLAGAMGKPTWILLPFCPDWRWLLDRDDSPWYPTVKLYRQQNIGEWAGALDRIRTDLISLHTSVNACAGHN